MKITKMGCFHFTPEDGFSIDGWEIDGKPMSDGNPTLEQTFAHIALSLDWVKYRLQLQMEETKGSC